MNMIKRGILPEEKAYKTTCSFCKSEFELNGFEVTEKSDGRNGTMYAVNNNISCTLCNKSLAYASPFKKTLGYPTIEQSTNMDWSRPGCQ